MTHNLHRLEPLPLHQADLAEGFIPRKSHQKFQMEITALHISPMSLTCLVHGDHVGCTASCIRFPPRHSSQVALCQVSQRTSFLPAHLRTLSAAFPSPTPNSAARGFLKLLVLPYRVMFPKVKSQKCPWC